MTEKWMIGSDIHDDLEALTAFADYAQAQEADRIILLGDMSLRPFTPQDLDSLAESRDVESFKKAKRRHSRQVLGKMKQVLDKAGISYAVIPGNYDGNSDVEAIFGQANLHKKTAQFGEAEVYGYGGADASPPHIMLLHELGEMEPFRHKDLYETLTRERADVYLVHNPPHLLCDTRFDGKNVGSPAITKHIADYAPRLVLSGHIHEAGPTGKNPRGVKGINAFENPDTEETTFVLNPGNLGRFELVHPRTLDPIK